MSKQMPRSQPRKARSRKVAMTSGNHAREFALAASALRLFTKRIVATGLISSNGAGLIVATTVANTNAVTAVGDFSALAGVYSNYRVKAIRVSFRPFYPVPTTATVVSPLIAVIPFRSGLVPSTFPAFSESSEVKYASGYEKLEFNTSNDGYPDGKLWHPTNAVIASADSYGVACMGQNFVAGTVTTNVWFAVIEYLTEFTVEN